MGNTHVINIIT